MALSVPAGPWTPQRHHGAAELPAALVVDGLAQRQIRIGGSIATQLVGPQEIVDLHAVEEDALVGAEVGWTALTPLRVVPLAPGGALERDPRLAAAVLRSAADQARRQALHRAVSQLPRVEDRLVGVLWLLAGRWGRVASAGVVVPLRLTHAVLGQLVGARRPTVTLALKQLAGRGAVTRRPDGSWLLAHR